jgi:hypothetical protein
MLGSASVEDNGTHGIRSDMRGASVVSVFAAALFLGHSILL